MNLYLLVEGSTEAAVYPAWLQYIAPQLRKRSVAQKAEPNSYYLFNAAGYPSIHHHLANAIRDLNDWGFYDFLVVCFDADGDTIEERIEKAWQHLEQEKVRLDRAQLVFCLANCCIETWFLGHRKLYRANPENTKLKTYADFYNVRDFDPELMPSHADFGTERQQFHKHYFKELARERNFKYSESRPGQTRDEGFLKELILRYQSTAHLQSFGAFYDFFHGLSEKTNADLA